MQDLTAFILAGGHSTRMGTDKARLEWHGRPLVEHMCELACRVAGKAVVVGRPETDGGSTVVQDVFPDRGPLGGIHAALGASDTELSLVLAVDMPFVEPRLLQYLAEEARLSNAVVTLPRVAGRWQPLCAIYRRSFAAAAETALRAGRNRIDALFADVPLRIVDDDELGRLAFAPAMFDNLNTRDQFEQARSRPVQSA